MSAKLETLLIVLISFLIGVAVIVLTTFLSEYGSYNRQQLRAFNRIHNTKIDVDTWTVYSYEIKDMYNFKPEMINKK